MVRHPTKQGDYWDSVYANDNQKMSHKFPTKTTSKSKSDLAARIVASSRYRVTSHDRQEKKFDAPSDPIWTEVVLKLWIGWNLPTYQKLKPKIIATWSRALSRAWRRYKSDLLQVLIGAVNSRWPF